MDIFKEAQANAIDYDRVLGKCTVKMPERGGYDISVIVPVRGRTEFNKILTSHFLDAIVISGMKINLTVVEHSEKPLHHRYCDEWVNYIWINSAKDPFNKCLAHNIGALYNQKSKYYLFHDVDTIPLSDYFIRLKQNIKDNDALQTFTGRRLLQCSQVVTKEIFQGISKIELLKGGEGGVDFAQPGASGGSILVSKEMFLKVGGFDPEFFTEYSVEDQFFFDKLNFAGKFGFADDPPIELFHLWHPPAYNRITKQYDFDILDLFNDLNHEEKTNLIKLKSDHLHKYFI